MTDTPDIMRMAGALARYSTARQGVVAANIANADTPGYRAQDLTGFSETWAAGDMRATRPGHIGASADTATPRRADTGSEASPNGNSVSLEDEMLRSVEVRRQNDLALAVYGSSLSILRSAIGKSR